MKKIIAIFIIAAVALFSLSSCQSTEEYYADKAIRVEVTHTSGSGGYETSEKYDLYFREIKKGDRYDLPNGDSNPYEVDFTVSDISKDSITLTFTQPMDRANGESPTDWECGLTFKLQIDSSELFITPTDGGGDAFRFAIIDKTDIPMYKIE